MAFLDLEEALVELGYAAAVPDRRELYSGGFRIYGGRKTSTPESRAYKREAWARYAAKRNAGGPPRREYRRHPPGTPRWLKGNVEKRKARVRARVREKRMTAKLRFQDFLGRLKKAGLVAQANVICVGRSVFDGRNRPDLRQLYEGRDPHHFEARLDFFVWLRNPDRAWTLDAIGALFDVAPLACAGALTTRANYAGEDLDVR